MVDRDKIFARIAFLETNLQKTEILRKYSSKKLADDFIKFKAAKHLLQVSIKAMTDIANHIIARKRLAPPASSADSFKILNENKIISDEVYAKCRLMTKFRNRIVHLYIDVEPEHVHDILHNEPQDFRSHIASIVRFLSGNI